MFRTDPAEIEHKWPARSVNRLLMYLEARAIAGEKASDTAERPASTGARARRPARKR